MNPEIKTKWLEALRSGEYEQGRGALVRKRYDGVVTHCCLGVLCELAVAEGIVERNDADAYDMMGYVEADGWVETGILPRAVAQWANINQHGEDRLDGLHLPSMNDAGTPFSVIADVIEKNF